MSSVNKVILLGNIGKDPEVRETKAGNIVNMVMATSEKYTDKSGQKQENTEWHNLVVFGKLADVVSKYVKKGDKLYVEGSITTRKWEDKEGNTRYNTEIKVRDLTMLGGGEKKSAQPAAVAAGDDEDSDLPF
jgi:single-strand DNA-binding protein|tara:strand:+ start:997 stop:1392 length:396 start_codon:yes stop_codon:yes gene_type:complete